MKIWAHALFKNEERWLWYSVTSIINHVDKLLLWDTGSTDKSWDIATKLKEKYQEKIDLKQYGEVTVESFYKARQAMLDETNSDWFLVVDGDEVWWDDSISEVISEIQKTKAESIVIPTINLVGDIYHKLPDNAGKYKFGNRVGHYNLRAINKNIEGLGSTGLHGVWGWIDSEGHQIQDRNTFQFVNAPYLHMSFLPRGNKRANDLQVPKRGNKLKYEIGERLPLDFYYPESFFREKPSMVPSPWENMTIKYKLKSGVLTLAKKLRRLFKNEKIGY